MQQFIERISSSRAGVRALSQEEIAEAARLVAEGQASDAQMAAFFMAMRGKGESARELEVFCKALQERSLKLRPPAQALSMVLDCGGSGASRDFAATIPVAVLCAIAGLPTVLHSAPRRGPGPGCSPEDVLRAAGCRPAQAAAEPEEDLRRQALAYVSRELFCPPLGRLRRVREDIAVGTLFDTAEKLLNVAGARRMLLGVRDWQERERLEAMALPQGVDTLVLVQGSEGSEDLPVSRVSEVLVLKRGKRGRHLFMDPLTYNLAGQPKRDEAPQKQAGLVEALLSGEDRPEIHAERNLVLYNAAFRLWIFGARTSMTDSLQEAAELLKSGKSLLRYFGWLKRGIASPLAA
jgi:anthranilate phosphoribosyltransferase